jgi:hypothetical protein
MVSSSRDLDEFTPGSFWAVPHPTVPQVARIETVLGAFVCIKNLYVQVFFRSYIVLFVWSWFVFLSSKCGIKSFVPRP